MPGVVPFARECLRALAVGGACLVLVGCPTAPPAAPDDASADLAPPGEDVSRPDHGALDTDATPETTPDAVVAAEITPDAAADATPDTPPDAPPPPLAIDDLLVFENPANALSTMVEWETNGAVQTRLEVTCGDDYAQSYGSVATYERHEVLVTGLWDGAECTFEAIAERDDGSERTTESQSRVIGPLPADMPTLILGAEIDLERRQPGWTSLNLTNTFTKTPPFAALVDELGRVRWYHRIETGLVGWDNAVTTVAGAVVFGGSNQVWTHLIGWDNDVLWKAHFASNHEAQVLDGRWLLHLRSRFGCGGGLHDAHRVYLYDLLEQQTAWRWVPCHHYEPTRNLKDWGHFNGVDFFPGGDAIVVSSRHQSSLMKVSYPEGELLWVMGYRGVIADGFLGDFTMKKADRFQEQHAPEVQPNGNLLVFDNGSCLSCLRAGLPIVQRGFSRALEIAYDETTMEAWAVWKYEPSPKIYAGMWSDADRLANGNTLVCFGVKSEKRGSILHEVAPDGELIWDLELPPSWGAYRAHRVEPYYGHVIGEQVVLNIGPTPFD